MDTMAFVEKFLKANEEYNFHVNRDERRFDDTIKKGTVCVSTSIICPQTDDKNNKTPFDKIISVATLNFNIPKKITFDFLAAISHISKENTWANIYLNGNNEVEANHCFQVWDGMPKEQLKQMLFAPTRLVEKHCKQFKSTLIKHIPGVLVDPAPLPIPIRKDMAAFKCSQCETKFLAPNIIATAYFMPHKCPKCGSTQTRPISLLGKLARWVYRRN